MSITTAPAAARYLSISDLAEQLGVSVQSIYRWRSEGRDLPAAFRVGGGTIRWTQESVDKWIAAQESKGAA